jgi:hypothetical protein
LPHPDVRRDTSIMTSAHLIAAACIAAAALPAGADCRWEWLCNGEGACKQMPLCDSVYETPPPRPAESQPPAVPPIAMRPFQVAGPMGTLTCEHIMRQDARGKWRWYEMCYCTDRSRSKDPSAPFANIVRCDSR